MRNPPVYMDCNATTPIDPEVLDKMIHCMSGGFGNASSQTHEYGSRAKQACAVARERVASVVRADPNEVVFTSGATEANNLALFGLVDEGRRTGRTHIVSTQIEHKSVLEPLKELKRLGFKVTLVRPAADGRVNADEVLSAVRDDTLLVSVMHVNNETGVVQPVDDIADGLIDRRTLFHVDAAQGYGKVRLEHPGVDLISISSHKVFGPMGIGALVARRKGHKRTPLKPMLLGGKQELGMRAGTTPVPLVVGFGVAADLAVSEAAERLEIVNDFRDELLRALAPLNPSFNGDQDWTLPHVLNVSVPGVDSDAAIVALKDVVSISSGSACNSNSHDLSYVLKAMSLTDQAASEAIRFSWCHVTREPDWDQITKSIARLR